MRPWVTLLLLLALASPALAGPPPRCLTYEEPTLNRMQTLCDDGTRATSTYSPTLRQWQTTITESPRPACQGQFNPRTGQVQVRCR
jgi:hypothetical protein